MGVAGDAAVSRAKARRKPRKGPTPDSRDYGTAELRQHHLVVIEGEGPGHSEQRARVVDQRPLDRYAAQCLLVPSEKHMPPEERSAINRRRYEAGLRLRRDWDLATRPAQLVTRWEPWRGGRADANNFLEVGQDTRRRMNSALDAVGPVLTPVLVGVVCCDESVKAWGLKHGASSGRTAMRKGMGALHLALERLVTHYGM